MKKTKTTTVGFVFDLALLGLLTGCAEYADGPQAGVYASSPSVYVEAGVAAPDDYIYYPAYQVYYSTHRRQYVYLHGRTWVSRPTPPRVSVNVLFASPSVRVDFHDSPANHHAEIVRQYPKHWAPPESNRGYHEDRRHGDKERY